MNKRLGFLLVLSATALAWVGCDGEQPAGDGGCPDGAICPGDDGGRDGGIADGGQTDSNVVTDPCALTAGRTIGAACSRNTCQSGLSCNEESSGTIPTVLPDLITRGPGIMVTFNPGGGVCTRDCTADAQCNDCSSCIGADEEGPGQCQLDCTPTLTTNGGCRTGWSCSIFNATCGLGCTNNDFCKIAGVHDSDGDGAPDSYIYDPTDPSTCNLATGRCETPGTAGARAGDPCEDASECEDNGFCLSGASFPDGFCTRIGCEWPGFECASGAVCDVRLFGDRISACMPGCNVGQEAEADRLGVGGSGDTCSAGQACLWSGTRGPADALNGSCFPGNYNDVTTPNVGGACQEDSDCYSPFGLGRCLFNNSAGQSGYCVVGGCARFMGASGEVDGLLPGVETTTRVCDTSDGELCVNFGSAEVPNTFCVPNCTNASECAPGFACTALLTGGGRLCWPTCEANADCRSGTECRNTTGGACGTNQECFCTDRMPRPTDGGMVDADGGMVDADGGMDADAGVPDPG